MHTLLNPFCLLNHSLLEDLNLCSLRLLNIIESQDPQSNEDHHDADHGKQDKRLGKGDSRQFVSNPLMKLRAGEGGADCSCSHIPSTTRHQKHLPTRL